MSSRIKTDKEIYEFCRSHYYCGTRPNDEGYNELCELHEYADKESIDELIDNDVYALKEFMGITKYGRPVCRQG